MKAYELDCHAAAIFTLVPLGIKTIPLNFINRRILTVIIPVSHRTNLVPFLSIIFLQALEA